eukprot:356934-Chlamydomonas_euryale.AAC.3
MRRPFGLNRRGRARDRFVGEVAEWREGRVTRLEEEMREKGGVGEERGGRELMGTTGGQEESVFQGRQPLGRSVTEQVCVSELEAASVYFEAGRCASHGVGCPPACGPMPPPLSAALKHIQPRVPCRAIFPPPLSHVTQKC